ncbi:HET-domain-containing protein [Corynespora cassiicola Philippines]|uniref:HET-domain-containing protein n=1 Tax=Corynespora cassiicola Philippines TaxID=1448308 RepID=A0A2T2PAI3_CORCC|nr:HET-domain-containing protein [Corynespora cassiicola Philippines]
MVWPSDRLKRAFHRQPQVEDADANLESSNIPETCSSPTDPPQPPKQLFVPWRPSSVCKYCRLLSNPRDESRHPHHSYLDLKISAARGCSLCQYFFKIIDEKPKERAVSKRLQFERHENIITMLDFTSTAMTFECFLNESTLLPNQNPPMSSIDLSESTRFRKVAANPELDESWGFINHWLTNCSTHHKECIGRLENSKVFPTRILDVSEDRTHLVIWDHNRKPAPYATLSYCWGRGPFRPTLQSNIEFHLNGIDETTLPNTLRDAIRVTRKMKVQYIWIDCLCIIQDMREDWSQEASRMGDYYRGAFVNISALGSQESFKGFLQARNNQPTAVLNSTMGIRPALPGWKDVFQNSPLSQRAWVLQERLMSNRTVHFGENELFWECSTISARESSTAIYDSRGQTIKWGDENFKRALLFATEDKMEIIDSWYTVVLQYSRLQLTFPRDVFPAIAGIAQTFHKATGFRYIAGLWVEDIHTGLLWYRRGLETNGLFKHEWKAPSWSWASIHGPIGILYDISSTRIEGSLQAVVVDTEASFPSDPFGAIFSAHLTLSAFCYHVWYKGSHGVPPFNDPYLSQILEIYDSKGFMVGTGNLDYLQDRSEGNLKTAVAIIVCQRKQEEEVITYFLLALPLTGEDEMGEYRRIGVGQTADPYYGSVNDAEDSFVLRERQTIRLI